MTTLDKRENAFEAEFAHQEELKFRARERAVRNLAIWAAGRLGKAGDALDAYARDVVDADITSPAIDATIKRVAEVLAPHGIGEKEIRRMMDRLMSAADLELRSPGQPSS
ncbi:MAG: DUF1476 domain-containing protein [Bradyrhizobium sp.]|nr:DUF1476 domain-containing protein [Bradyrhizobium sp.]